MLEVAVCPECGVPKPFTEDNVWLNSGAIVQASDKTRRVGFIESENLDPVYQGIEEIIGIPISHLVIDVIRKGTLDYIRNITLPRIQELIQNPEGAKNNVPDFLMTNGHVCGFGKYEMLDMEYVSAAEGHMTVRLTDPFSVLLSAGIQAGCGEAILYMPHEVTYKEVSTGVYEIKAYVSEHPQELEKRLTMKPYHHKEGDCELEECATCGGPKALSSFKWDLEMGKIFNISNSRRNVLIGPEAQDPLFEDLEKELGEAIPAAVIEAQRRFIKTGGYSIDEMINAEEFRTQLALRGLGNLRKVDLSSKSLRVRIDNAASYLMIVGMAQALFETATDVESSVQWELSEDGNLEIEVIPRKTSYAILIEGSSPPSEAG
jgi:hypothetical protein